MNQVFSDLRENRLLFMEISVLESFQEQEQCKSMFNMAFKTNFVGDAPEAMHRNESFDGFTVRPAAK